MWFIPTQSAANMALKASLQNNTTKQKVSLARPQIDVVFALDTTGSMGGLIQAAKQKIWSIASSMASANNAPDIRMGLIAYRDRGDQYVTYKVDLTQDLDKMYAQLMKFQASGGGDGPESVNQALYEAVNTMGWRNNTNTYKTVFLIGDAPPHMNYQNDVPYSETIKLARKKGIVINTIQCGNLRATKYPWMQIAQLSQGEYFNVNQTGSAVAINTPFDKSIAQLSAKMDHSVIAYGDKASRAKLNNKMKTTQLLEDKLSIPAKARRAQFNQSKSGKNNNRAKNDLIHQLNNGVIKIEDIKTKDLPATLASLPAPKRQRVLEEKMEQRQQVQQELDKVIAKRKQFLEKEVAKLGGLKGSLDAKIYHSIKKQAKEKGIQYKKDNPQY